MEDNNETFSYAYSAKQQEEIRKIRDKYMPHEESTLERLRRLDQSVTIPGRIAAVAVGGISCLILGIGMCCIMVWGGELLFAVGIIVGIIGVVGICAAYPLNIFITKKRKEKLAPEIIRLSNKLIK